MKGGCSVAKSNKSLTRRESTMLNYMKNGGNMKQAMIDAGYSASYADKNARYLLGIIGRDIEHEQEDIRSEKIKSVIEIQEWWSKQMDAVENDMSIRMKASEYLAKSQGGFIEKIQATMSYEDKLKEIVDEDEY